MAGKLSRRQVMVYSAAPLVAAGLLGTIATATSADLELEAQAARLAEALNAVRPGHWVVDVCPKQGFVLVHWAS
jgi:hypothetical protein